MGGWGKTARQNFGDIIERLNPDRLIIGGGTDQLNEQAKAWAVDRSFPTFAFPGLWEGHIRLHGYRRMHAAFRDGRPTHVLLFEDTRKFYAYVIKKAYKLHLPLAEA